MSPAPEPPPVPFDVPGGWYHDPRGAQQYRYWDGFGWTDHVVPVPAGRAPEIAAPRSARRRGSLPWIFALLVLAGFLAALVVLEDSGDQELRETAAARRPAQSVKPALAGTNMEQSGGGRIGRLTIGG